MIGNKFTYHILGMALWSTFFFPVSLPLKSQDVLAGDVFKTGDIFAATGNGKVNWYHANGSLVKVLDTGRLGYTTGMAFDGQGNLYVTNFGGGTVTRFDTTGNLIGTFGSGYSGSPESIVFDAAGFAYIGSVNGDSKIRKFDPSGNLVSSYAVPIDDRGSDWIDLSVDQKTIFYTSEGRRILRYDVSDSGHALADFVSLPGSGVAYALRLLPPGDGTGGLLVADSENIKRLDRSGNILRTYDVPNEDSWFALNLDADGTSFWSGGIRSGKAYKFDITTGAIKLGPITTCTESICLGGLTVFRERQASSFNLRLPFDLLSSTSRADGTDRINTYFDHQYPTYTSCPNSNKDNRCKDFAYANLVRYDGQDKPSCSYVGEPDTFCYDGHPGYDYRGTEGTTAVLAAHRGRATGTTETCKGLTKDGHTVTSVINVVNVTDGRYRTSYLHLYDDHYWNDLVATPRDVVAGERIGTVGNTGSPACSSGPHLHFQVYYDQNNDGQFSTSEVIDPYGYSAITRDPWEAYSGSVSKWLWKASQSAQTNLVPGNIASLASDFAIVEFSEASVTKSALLSLVSVPDPTNVISNFNLQQGSTNTIHDASNAETIGIGTVSQLEGIYDDGALLTKLAAPFTFTFFYSSTDAAFIMT